MCFDSIFYRLFVSFKEIEQVEIKFFDAICIYVHATSENTTKLTQIINQIELLEICFWTYLINIQLISKALKGLSEHSIKSIFIENFKSQWPSIFGNIYSCKGFNSLKPVM